MRVPGPLYGVAGARRRRPTLVRRSPLDRAQALASHQGRVLRCAIGRSSVVTVKREGDGGTPRARVETVVMFCDRAPSQPRLWRKPRASDGWCEAPASLQYNGWVPRGALAPHEVMARVDGLYEYVVMTDHNQRPRRRGAGSAIFIHVARAALTPTEGCLAFPRAAWRRGTVPAGPYLIGVEPRPLR